MNNTGLYFLLLNVAVCMFFFHNSSNFWKKPKTYIGFVSLIGSVAMLHHNSEVLECIVFLTFMYTLLTSLVRLSKHVYKDPLTRLYNRRYLENNPIEVGSKVIFIDIDKFKSINDNYGHAIGDMVLADVAEVLKGSVRGNDACIRIGGDEFLIVAHGSRDSAMIEKRIEKRLNEYNEDASPKVSISMGAQTYQGGKLDTFIHTADDLMYEQKRKKCEEEQ